MSRRTINRHACAIPGCKAGAKIGQLMCWPHWRRVPKALNRAVFDTFAMIGRGTTTIDHVRAYRQAKDAAIAAVQEKEAEG